MWTPQTLCSCRAATVETCIQRSYCDMIYLDGRSGLSFFGLTLN